MKHDAHNAGWGAEVPAAVHRALDVPNWRANAEAFRQHYMKTYVRTGSIKPLQHVVGGLFLFNLVYSLPREMAHNKHAQDERFHVARH